MGKRVDGETERKKNRRKIERQMDDGVIEGQREKGEEGGLDNRGTK